MAIKNIIAEGIGFSPGSIKFIITGGFTIGVGITWTTIGVPAVYENSPTAIGLEVFMRQTTGTAEARLFDNTADAAVASSQISTTSATNVRVRSGALGMVDGNEYEAQFGTLSADEGKVKGAKMVIV